MCVGDAKNRVTKAILSSKRDDFRNKLALKFCMHVNMWCDVMCVGGYSHGHMRKEFT